MYSGIITAFFIGVILSGVNLYTLDLTLRKILSSGQRKSNIFYAKTFFLRQFFLVGIVYLFVFKAGMNPYGLLAGLIIGNLIIRILLARHRAPSEVLS